MTPEFHELRRILNERLTGIRTPIDLCLSALLSRGHVLIEDVPGIGKTMLARHISALIGGDTRRIQFTSDLLPSDVLGVSVFHANRGAFEFKKGPIFAHLVLADELNRGSPKAQAAFLEAMSEGTVSVDGHRYHLPEPFMVIATQNPFEQAGVYPLIESQLDRFTVRTSLGYPEEEGELVAMRRGWNPFDERLPSPVASLEDWRSWQSAVDDVAFAPDLLLYLRRLAAFTREKARPGLSTRGLVQTTQLVKAWAWIHDRSQVIPEDIRNVLPAALAHRIPEGSALVQEALSQVDL